MPVPYEHVLRHEIPPFTRACLPCVQQTLNIPCSTDWCHCLCRLGPSAPVAMDQIDPPEWFEPPTRPELIATWETPLPDIPDSDPDEAHNESTVGDNLWTRLLRRLRGGTGA
jgi:hypothetical protein